MKNKCSKLSKVNPLMSKINTQKIVSIISSVIPSYYPIKEVSLLLYSKKLKSFCQLIVSLYFCFVVYAIIILLIAREKQEIFINKVVEFYVVKKEVSPL